MLIIMHLGMPSNAAREAASGRAANYGASLGMKKPKPSRVAAVVKVAAAVIPAAVLVLSLGGCEDASGQGSRSGNEPSASRGPDDAIVGREPPAVSQEPPISPSPSPSPPTPTPSPSPTDEATETPPLPPPGVQSILLTYAGLPIRDKDFSGTVNEQVWLDLRIEPPGVEFTEEITWVSSDTSVFQVVPMNERGTSARVAIIGSGSENSALLTVSLGELTDTSWVRVRR